jgi:DNA (cytosine-5)-methyltransferase 1
MKDKLRVLDLFSGIGGFSLGLEATGGFETAAFCEYDAKARAVLSKHWPGVPIHHDIRELTGDAVGHVDIITGGYPCQPFSTAGKRLGDKDDRHLWPEMFRLIQELRPTWVIGENVAGHVTMGLDQVLSDLESEGYAARPFVIPACAVDAHHRRDRIWAVATSHDAYPNSQRSHRTSIDQQRNDEPVDRKKRKPRSVCKVLAGQRNPSQRQPDNVQDPKRVRRAKMEPSIAGRPESEGPTSKIDESSGPRRWQGWIPEPPLGRVADGVPGRVDSLRQLGNSIVPEIARRLGLAILEVEGR